MLDQCGAVGGALGRLAQRVQLQAHVLQAQQLPEPGQHDDHFGIDIGAGKAQRLDIDLMELAVAPRCGRSWRNTGPIA